MKPRGPLVRSLLGLPLVPSTAEVDQLGLPLLCPDTQEAKEDCRKKALALVKDAFATMTYLLGEDEAKAIFTEASRSIRGRPKYTRRYEMNAHLLSAYDEIVSTLPESERGSAPRLAAEYLKGERVYPGTPEAAARQLRRLLKERQERQRNSRMPRSLAAMLRHGH